MSYVWVWPNFKIILFRGSHEHPTEQTKQTVNAKSSCQSQQRNANQGQARKHDIRKESCRAKLQPTNQPTNHNQTNQASKAKEISQAKQASQQANQAKIPSHIKQASKWANQANQASYATSL